MVRDRDVSDAHAAFVGVVLARSVVKAHDYAGC